jgi:hypothetical protein
MVKISLFEELKDGIIYGGNWVRKTKIKNTWLHVLRMRLLSTMM